LRLVRLPLLGSAVHALSHRVAPPGRREWTRVRSGPAAGIELLLDARYDAAFARGTVEADVQARLVELVRPGSIVWDVGAHVGFFTLLLARLVGEGGKVLAFEPDQTEPLRAALDRNGVENVEVRPVAVWSTVGSLRFDPRGGDGTHGAVATDGAVFVPSTTLDRELEHGVPQLVKIDVEGAEEEVLLGGPHLLLEHRPIVVCEVHVARRGRIELLPHVRGLLESAGYLVEEIDPDRRPVHLVATPISQASAREPSRSRPAVPPAAPA
jgi:FkbM family methyltransferase